MFHKPVIKLDTAVSGLKGQVGLVHKHLDYLQSVMKTEFEDKYPSDINPVKLYLRVETLKRRLKVAEATIKTLAGKKEGIVKDIANVGRQIKTQIEQICLQIRLSPSIVEDLAVNFSAEAIKYSTKQCSTFAIVDLESGSSTVNSQGGNPPPIDTKTDHELFGITTVEFENLPKHTRQRTKLAFVNKQYSKLFDLYMKGNKKSKDKKRRRPLQNKELAQNGLKLHGATGQTVINILRCLKLITTSAKGIELAKPYRKPQCIAAK